MSNGSNFPVYDIPREQSVREQLADLSYAQRQVLLPIQQELAHIFGEAHEYQDKTLGRIERRLGNSLAKLSEAQYNALYPIEQSMVNRMEALAAEQRVLAAQLPSVPQVQIMGLPPELQGRLPARPALNQVYFIDGYQCLYTANGWMCGPVRPTIPAPPTYTPLPPTGFPPQPPLPPVPPDDVVALPPAPLPPGPINPDPGPAPQPQPQPPDGCPPCPPQQPPVIYYPPQIPQPQPPIIVPPQIPQQQPQPPQPPAPRPPKPVDDILGEPETCHMMDSVTLDENQCPTDYPSGAVAGALNSKTLLDLCDDPMW